MITINDIASLDNLYLAWCKLEKCASFTEAWYSEMDFKKFKLNLRHELHTLSQQLIEGTFKLYPIRPIPYPKGSDKEGNLRVRQAFRFSVRDQVAWVALCNVIGGVADEKMPGWSYGNRLYLPMWKARQQDIEFGYAPNAWVFGNYRNTKPFLYRKWKQSWPMYRRMVTTSLRKMANVDLSDNDLQTIEEGSFMHSPYRPPYIEEDYFKGIPDKGDDVDDSTHNLYWIAIDLSKFYPNIDLDRLKHTLIEECQIDSSLHELINNLFDFQVDFSGFDKDILCEMGLIDEEGIQQKLGLPTGLVVAGWLANVYFLPIDRIMAERLEANREVIHFRYVDDHTIIARTAEKLLNWIELYVTILQEYGLSVNEDKMTPLESDSVSLIRKLIEGRINEDERTKLTEAIKEQCAIDPKYPSPLMTQTLEKISDMADVKLGLMTKREKKSMFHDLQTLIVTDIPEEEIKKETRISFASTMLSRLMEGEDFDHHLIYDLRNRLYQYVKRYRMVLEQESDRTSDSRRQATDAVSILEKVLYEAHPMKDSPLWKSLKQEEIDCCRALIDHLAETKYGFYKKAIRISDLLQRAVRYAPDKLNLWIRLLKFTLYNIPERTLLVFKLLEKQKDENKLHIASYRYIRSQLENVVAIALVRSVFSQYKGAQIETTSLVDILEKQRIEEIMGLPENKAEDYYELESADALMIAKAFKEVVLDSNRDRFHSIIEKGMSPALGLLWSMSTLRMEETLHLNIFNIFPDLDSLIKEIDPFGELLVESLLCQPVDYSQYPLAVLRDRFNIKPAPEPKHSLEFEGEEYINVSKWISLLKQRPSNEEGAIDVETGPYESEYIAMRAIVGLVEEWSAQMQDRSNDNPLSPLSFYFKLKDIKRGWENIQKDLKIQVLIGEESEYDRTYPYPAFVKTRYDKSVFSIGLLLLQLLSLTSDISWILQQPEYGYKWTHLLDSIFSKGKISSFVYRLIEECLSPVTRENNVLRSLLGDNYLDIPFYEGYKIENVNQLNDKVHDLAENKLWANIICLAHNRHMELTVIDLQ